MIMDTMMAGIANRQNRGCDSRELRPGFFSPFVRLTSGRTEETWEGVPGVNLVRPPMWIKNILRKRYLS